MRKLLFKFGRGIFALTLIAVSVSESIAKVVPGSMVTDNMVLQQNGKACIYGSADPGEKVTVTPSWNNIPYQTKADKSGKWELFIDTPEGGFTPYTMTITDGSSITISNILIGEVWLASGQSNMEMPLKGFPGCCIENGYDEIASSRQQANRIRFYTVPLTQSYTPLDTINASWAVPSPETAPEFSAIAWNFAKRMTDVLDVPVGIVRCA